VGVAVPPELSRLLAAPPGPGPESDEAWAIFVAAHSPLIIRVARSIDSDHDAVMDAYAYVLEGLRTNDCRRLRDYAPDGRTKFTTWLVVVARRLCLDLLRRRYGRSPPVSPGADVAVQRGVRRRLVDLVAGADPDEIAAPHEDPTNSLNAAEVSRTLTIATGRLHADDRLLLKLRFDDDLSAAEIARLVGLPTPFHVYRRLTVLFSELRRALREHGIHEAEP
jgi:RNA polymerase sigma factor (sigma-70 family)